MARAMNSAITNGTKGIKKVLNETFNTVSGRVKDAEKLWAEGVGHLNIRIQEVEKDAKQRMDSLFEQLSSENLLEQFKGGGLYAHVTTITTETVERLGLLQRNEVVELDENLAKTMTRLETLRKRVSGTATKASVKSLEKRLAGLEKKIASLEKGKKKA